MERKAILTTPQNLTAAWADLGAEIPMSGFNKIGIFASLDINDSLNPRIRALAKLDSGGTKEYIMQISTINANVARIESGHYEWNVDADVETILTIDTEGLIPFIQLQVMAGTAGASPGQIDYCEIVQTQTHKLR